MQHNTVQLTESLSSDIRQLLLQAEQLKSLTANQLLQKPDASSWSIAECLQHLNFYSDYYLPAIEKAVGNFSGKSSVSFRSGLLGGYFTKLMRTKENGTITKKMKSPKNATPTSDVDGAKELEQFIRHQHLLLNLLNITAKSNLHEIRIPISIFKLIKLRLGDVLMFFVEHEKRHMLQILRVRASLSTAE